MLPQLQEILKAATPVQAALKALESDVKAATAAMPPAAITIARGALQTAVEQLTAEIARQTPKQPAVYVLPGPPGDAPPLSTPGAPA